MSDASDSTEQAKPRLLVRLMAVAIVLGVSVVFALLLSEVVIRFTKPQQLIQIRPDLWESADTVGYLRKPNASVRMNTGERTVTIYSDADRYRVGSKGRTESPTRVLLIGDSFMEALQVEHEQTLAHLLETRVSERLGRPVAVRNAGVVGWNPNHYLLRTRQLLARDTFALIVVAVFVGNDAVPYRVERFPPREAVERHSFRLPKSMSWGEVVNSFLAPINDALEVRSHLYIFAKNQLSTLRMRLGMTADYLPVEYRRDEAESVRWKNTAELSRDLAQLGAARRTPVLFVLVPERFQVYPDEFTRYIRGFGIDSTLVDVEQPSRLLAREFDAQKLRFVDALPAMRAAAAKGGPWLFGKVDQHLSPEGHAALADVVLPEMLKLLPK